MVAYAKCLASSKIPINVGGKCPFLDWGPQGQGE